MIPRFPYVDSNCHNCNKCTAIDVLRSHLNVTFVISFITKLQYVELPWVASTSTNCSLGPLFIKQQCVRMYTRVVT